MKIGFFGDGEWSHNALKQILLNKKYKVSFIVPRYHSPDKILESISKEKDIDFLIFKNVNDQKNLKKLKNYNCDIFVSMSYDQIIKKELIAVPPKGFINCHAGALPFYRGRNVLNWVLINDEKNFGITAHYIDEGIDTGDIILQEKFPITDDDDYSSLLEIAYFNCPIILLKAINMINESKAKRLPQNNIDSYGSYYRKRLPGDEFISWKWTSRRIFNFIRSLTLPGPIARTTIYNKEIFIKKSKLIKNQIKSNNLPGTILKIDKEGILVKTIDSCLIITDYSFFHNNNYSLKINDIFTN